MTQMDYFSWPTSRFNSTPTHSNWHFSTLLIHRPRPCFMRRQNFPSQIRQEKSIISGIQQLCMKVGRAGEWVREMSGICKMRHQHENPRQAHRKCRLISTAFPPKSNQFRQRFIHLLWRYMQSYPLPKEPSPSPHFTLIQYRVEKLLEISPPIRFWDFCSLSD